MRSDSLALVSPLVDLAPPVGVRPGEVLAGLRAPAKRLPCKLFYDATGSALFDRICKLPEYYPTRTEIGILTRNAAAMAERLGERCLLIEYGSGSSHKTRILLDHLRMPAGYMPIDISKKHLLAAVAALARDYPTLPIHPVCADYSNEIALPATQLGERRRAVFFPGSTIGNFEPEEVVPFLRRLARLVHGRGGALIGVDLKKDPVVLQAAYDDADGVTAAFNKNALAHLNRVAGADFDLDAFDHLARYDQAAGRIEMYLVSRRDQRVEVDGESIHFAAGERLHTENSYKYTPEEFAALAERAGMRTSQVWTDDARRFSVHHLVPR